MGELKMTPTGFDVAAGLILDVVEETFMLSAPAGRDRGQKAILSILDHYCIPKDGVQVDGGTLSRFCAILGPEIEKERALQDAQWGGPSHDDNEHDRWDWPRFIEKFAQRAMDSAYVDDKASIASYESAMVKVAALAVAAIQSSRRRK